MIISKSQVTFLWMDDLEDIPWHCYTSGLAVVDTGMCSLSVITEHLAVSSCHYSNDIPCA